MTIISLIAAVDEKLGLGQDNHLLCHLPADLKHFKQLTLGKPVIMGRKTFESIGKPLPGRLNIVLSRQKILIDGVTVLHSMNQALEAMQDVPEIMIIGGSTLFEQAMPLAQRIYLTKIHHTFSADVFFPKMDLSRWTLHSASSHSHDLTNEYDMTFYHYERTLPKMNSCPSDGKSAQ